MTQLLLNLQATPPPLLDNYVAGGNGELLSRLRGLADRGSFDALYLWGGDGCGKSHLLAGAIAEAAKQRPTRLLAAHDITNDFAPPPGALLAVDDVHQLDAAAQIDLFRVFNAARLAGLALLLAGNQPPARLMLREDLRTRIGQMLVFEIKPLSDEQKSAALIRHAQLRGMPVDDNLVRYLLTHGRRDLNSLMTVLDNLDRATLQQQRQATLPLLKEIMQLQLAQEETLR